MEMSLFDAKINLQNQILSKTDPIFYQDIRFSKMNVGRDGEGEEELVENMADMLATDPENKNRIQQESLAVVYEDTTPNDGKRYTLLSGHLRCKAVQKAYEEGKGDGLLYCRIDEKPKNDFDEFKTILRHNFQTERDADYKQKVVERFSEFYEKLMQDPNAEKPGQRKRAWIAEQCKKSGVLNLGERTIQKFLTGDYPLPDRSKLEQAVDLETEEEIRQKMEMERIDKEQREKLASRVVNACGIKNARINKKYNSITINVENKEDLMSFLALLGMKDEEDSIENTNLKDETNEQEEGESDGNDY